MENKADMPRWNKFVQSVLNGEFKEQKKEKQYTEEKDSEPEATGKR